MVSMENCLNMGLKDTDSGFVFYKMCLTTIQLHPVPHNINFLSALLLRERWLHGGGRGEEGTSSGAVSPQWRVVMGVGW